MMMYSRCKEDCYWYEELQDMSANIPCCKCKKGDFIKPQDCANCEQYHSKYKPTNADKIRMMTDEELTEWFMFLEVCPNGGAVDCKRSCKRCWLE